MDTSILNSFVIMLGMAIGCIAYLFGYSRGYKDQEVRIKYLRNHSRRVTEERNAAEDRLEAAEHQLNAAHNGVRHLHPKKHG